MRNVSGTMPGKLPAGSAMTVMPSALTPEAPLSMALIPTTTLSPNSTRV